MKVTTRKPTDLEAATYHLLGTLCLGIHPPITNTPYLRRTKQLNGGPPGDAMNFLPARVGSEVQSGVVRSVAVSK
jgi:hypothetical protein